MTLVVATVVLNDPAGLARTLSSLAEQESRFELLIVDGASNQDTLRVARDGVAALGGQLISRKDEGPYDAMNFALSVCSADDLLWFVNAGDGLTDGSVVQDVLSWTSHSDFAWGFGPVRVLEEDGHLRKVPRSAPYSPMNVAKGLTPICHQTVVAKVACMREVGGFDTSYGLAADFKLALRLSRNWYPCVWPRPIAEYRAGGMSDRRIFETMSQQRRIRNSEMDFGVLERLQLTALDARRALRLLAGWGLDWGVDHGAVPRLWRSKAAAVESALRGSNRT